MAYYHTCQHCGDQDHACYEVKCHYCLADGWTNEFDFMGYDNGNEYWQCDKCASVGKTETLQEK